MVYAISFLCWIMMVGQELLDSFFFYLFFIYTVFHLSWQLQYSSCMDHFFFNIMTFFFNLWMLFYITSLLLKWVLNCHEAWCGHDRELATNEEVWGSHHVWLEEQHSAEWPFLSERLCWWSTSQPSLWRWQWLIRLPLQCKLSRRMHCDFF